MKKINILYLLIPALLLGACKKSLLQLNNPNAPTPASSLTTEAGIDAFAMGVYQKWIVNVPGDGQTNIFDVAFFQQSDMGDEDFMPYSNFGGRYPTNVDTIYLPAPYNKAVPNPSGFTQIGILRSKNSRVAGDQNSVQYEWAVDYFMNGQANFLLAALDNPALNLTGDATTKKGLLKAWAYYWKGFAYSRLGSMYLGAVVNDNPANGLTDSVYLSHDAMITAANANFDKAVAILTGLTNNADYQATFKAIIPSFNLNTQVIDPAMWVRMIHTYEARNFLVNHKVASMSPSDWNTVATLASTGMVPGDHSLMWGMAAGGINDLTTQNNNIGLGFWWHPFALHTAAGGQLSFVSERFIQDFQPGDTRYTKNFRPIPTGAIVNVLNRGIQFGTRYQAIEIDSGGLFASQTHKGAVPIGPTWEENTLMIAEAKIRGGTDIDGGLALIDQVRAAQGAGLPATSGTGLTQAQAIDQLRSERRIALYLRGLAWFDARRWGITAPTSQGGGRNNANVVVPGNLLGSNPTPPAQVLPCRIVYNFVDYWDVPQNELDFNGAAAGSAVIKN
ncbi:MAG: RagB/SusD family nutrient uptake outer membrane protein [Bacteroidota bacterium]|nr:RagB/SusD family nutrient uptake outer membrane protein [Bacteroidota bacterium]